MDRKRFSCYSDALITALEEIGLEARRFQDEDGKSYLVVPMLDMTAEHPLVDAKNPELTAYLRNAAQGWGDWAYLYIAAEEIHDGCRVGMIGRNIENGEAYRSDTWQTTTNLQEAVETFKELWDNRDEAIGGFTNQVEGG
jgi:hypothetical protein